MTPNHNDGDNIWKTTIIISTSLRNHDVPRMLCAQQHRIRFSDSVEPGALVFPLSGIAFLIVDPQQLPEELEDTDVFDNIKKFVQVHRNSFLLLQASVYGKKELEILSVIQHRFLGSSLRVLPVHSHADTVKAMLTIAKATSKPYVERVRERMSQARGHIIESSPVWEILRDQMLS